MKDVRVDFYNDVDNYTLELMQVPIKHYTSFMCHIHYTVYIM